MGGYSQPWSKTELETIRSFLKKTGGVVRRDMMPGLPFRTKGAIEHKARRMMREGQVEITTDSVDIPIEVEEDGIDHSPTDWAIPPKPTYGDDFDRLMGILKGKKDAIPFEQLCDELELSPKLARDLIRRAREKGLNVDVTGESVGIPPPSFSPFNEKVVPIQAAGDWRIFAVASDIHIGSRHHLRGPFHDFVKLAYARGVRLILHPGDLLDGVYRFSRWEQHAQGFDEQAGEAAKGGLPAYEGLRWLGISGNHDETFERDSGMVAHKAIVDLFRAHGRDDLEMIGARGAYTRLTGPGDRRGLFVELWHPRGSPAYSLSYKLQKKIESFSPGQKPDALFAGHWHQQNYCCVRGVHAFLSGTWQGGQSSFGKSLGSAPSIGGWIIQYRQTPDGTVRNFQAEWVGYFENETVREVGLT